jgi:hypothetical protein
MFLYISDNLWGVLGVLVSGIGLLFAFLQLRKIANRTAAIDKTYKQTIKNLENNDNFTNISTVLQKIETIKNMIQDNKINSITYDLSTVSRLLTTLESSLSGHIDDLDLETPRNLCSDLEVRIITEQTDLDKSLLKDEYVAFSGLELMLTKIQSELKYKRN